MVTPTYITGDGYYQLRVVTLDDGAKIYSAITKITGYIHVNIRYIHVRVDTHTYISSN